MDRLSSVIFALAVACAGWPWVLGCEDGAPSTTQRRVVSVAADRSHTPDLSSFCDVQGTAGAARRLVFPPLDSAPARPSGSRSWRWVNVWATWCRPCIEEMPMLRRWDEQLDVQGVGVDLVFLSVDESVEVIERFRATHPQTPPSLRLADPEALTEWITGLGLDPGATLPIHVFADPDARVRCVRSGALNEDHLVTVRHLISSL